MNWRPDKKLGEVDPGSMSDLDLRLELAELVTVSADIEAQIEEVGAGHATLRDGEWVSRAQRALTVKKRQIRRLDVELARRRVHLAHARRQTQAEWFLIAAGRMIGAEDIERIWAHARDLSAHQPELWGPVD